MINASIATRGNEGDRTEELGHELAAAGFEIGERDVGILLPDGFGVPAVPGPGPSEDLRSHECFSATHSVGFVLVSAADV